MRGWTWLGGRLRRAVQAEHTLVSVSSAFVYCYGKEPGFEAALAAELFQAEKRREKGLLSNVLDVSGPAEQPICQKSYLGGILRDNSLESRFVASLELLNQQFIIGALGHGYHIRAPGRRNITRQMWKILQIGPRICGDWASFSGKWTEGLHFYGEFGIMCVVARKECFKATGFAAELILRMEWNL